MQPANVVFVDYRNIQCGWLEWRDAAGNLIRLTPGKTVAEAPASHSRHLLPYGLRIEVQKARKEPPLDDGRNVPGQVMYDEGLYRAWGLGLNKSEIVYRESNDGYDWREKSACPIDTHGARPVGEFSFFKDEAGPASERYKALLNCRVPNERREEYYARLARMPPGRRDERQLVREKLYLFCGVYGAVSADGLCWQMFPEPFLIHKGDTDTSVYYDASRQEYVMYSRLYIHDRRWIGRATSQDFRSWTTLDPMIRPRLDDPLTWDVYLNARTAYPGQPEAHLMFPMIYHRDDEGSHLECYSSADGVSWERLPGGPVLEPGPPGSWDGAFISVGKDLVPLGRGRIAVPYNGTPYPHKHPRWENVLKSHRTTWAWWPRGRLAAVVADEQGELYTSPAVPAGRELRLNCSVQTGGEIRVGIVREGEPADSTEVRGPTGQRTGVDVGLGIADCAPITGDHDAKVVVWNGQGAPEGGPVALHFLLRNAKLFGYEWV